MTESEEIEEIKRSLHIIRKRAGSLKDDFVNFLLDMTILHLSRKIASAADEQTTLTMFHRKIERNNSSTLDFPHLGDLGNDCLPNDTIGCPRMLERDAILGPGIADEVDSKVPSRGLSDESVPLTHSSLSRRICRGPRSEGSEH